MQDPFSPNVLLILAAFPERDKYAALNALKDLFSPNVLLILAALLDCNEYGALNTLQDFFPATCC